MCIWYFFVNSTATTDVYTDLHTLSLHDALPICAACEGITCSGLGENSSRIVPRLSDTESIGVGILRTPSFANTEYAPVISRGDTSPPPSTRVDRKSTRLNSSH